MCKITTKQTKPKEKLAKINKKLLIFVFLYSKILSNPIRKTPVKSRAVAHRYPDHNLTLQCLIFAASQLVRLSQFL